MITVMVRHFAALREQRGCAEESVDLPPQTSVEAAYFALFPQTPRIPVAFLRNRAQVPAHTPLEDGDELAFLPPFGGG